MDNERRAKSRYEMNLNVRYQTMGLAGPVSGIGKTLNVSSGGVFITGGDNVREGTRMKLVIEWPSLLNGTTPLQLITIGVVVRRESSGVAISFEGYQFRTAGRRGTLTAMPQTHVAPSYSNPPTTGLQMLAKSSH